MSIGTPANACTCIAFPSARKRSTTPRWSSTSMVRECRPLDRELSSLTLGRRSTMRTSVPASVSSAASIIPVGPPPAITTACSVTLSGRCGDERLAPDGAPVGGLEQECPECLEVGEVVRRQKIVDEGQRRLQAERQGLVARRAHQRVHPDQPVAGSL